jgi:hypothetical protein
MGRAGRWERRGGPCLKGEDDHWREMGDGRCKLTTTMAEAPYEGERMTKETERECRRRQRRRRKGCVRRCTRKEEVGRRTRKSDGRKWTKSRS